MTRRCVFLGPTLSHAEASSICEATYQPPARRGDVVRAVLSGARVVAVIDGLKHQTLAVTHKEVLFALDRGVQVFGAASLGPLRAAEMADYGMIGVGKIFEAYCNRTCTSDEVAVSHGPAELGYPVVSEAMVNVRATVAAAVAAGVITDAAMGLISIAKALHFPERTWSRVIRAAKEEGLVARELDAFEDWLPTGQVDQKRLDAIALLKRLADNRSPAVDQLPGPRGFRPTQAFASLYRQVYAETSHQIDGTASPVAIEDPA